MAFKRKRVFAPRRSSGKRRRSMGRRFKRRSWKSAAYTSKTTRPISNYFARKGRLTPGKIRRWKRNIFRSTQFKDHYRSLYANSGTFATPANETTATLNLLQAVDNGSAPFWAVGGGAINTQTGTLPLFTGDVVIRGGVASLVVNNNDNNSQMNVDVYFIGRTDGFDNSSVVTPQVRFWDPTCLIDFDLLVGKPLKKWSTMLEPLESLQCEMKLGVMKISPNEWSADEKRPHWMVLASSNDGTAITYTVVTGINLSFAADAIGTT